MSEPQPDGVYPRVNAATMNQHLNKIVSLVGRFQEQRGNVVLIAADQGRVTLDLSQAATDVPVQNNDMVVEIVGIVQQPGVIMVFVVRELSADMDLETYNRMLAVQQNPKFAHYFAFAPSMLMQ